MEITSKVVEKAIFHAALSFLLSGPHKNRFSFRITNISSFTWHSHITRERHPACDRARLIRLSRSMFPESFFSQNATLLCGRIPLGHEV
jgi:hypothetical protein